MKFSKSDAVQKIFLKRKTSQISEGENLEREKMNDFRELIDKYFNSLNEIDGAHRRRLIEEVWAEDGKFVSPIGAVAGFAAINAQINIRRKKCSHT